MKTNFDYTKTTFEKPGVVVQQMTKLDCCYIRKIAEESGRLAAIKHIRTYYVDCVVRSKNILSDIMSNKRWTVG